MQKAMISWYGFFGEQIIGEVIRSVAFNREQLMHQNDTMTWYFSPRTIIDDKE